jgi:PAS domain S-box-containing protein
MARRAATDTAKTIAALKARVKALEDELEFSRNPIVRLEVDRNRRIVDANETLARIAGRSVAQLKRCRVYTVLSKYGTFVDMVLDHFFEGTPYPGPARGFTRMQIKDTRRYFQFSVRPRRDRRGTIRTLSFTGRDITVESLSARIEELRRHVEFLFLTLDRIGMGCVHAYSETSTRFSSRVLMSGISNGMADLLGYTMLPKRTKATYFRHKPELYMHPISRMLTPATIRALTKQAETGSKEHVEGEIIAHDGSTRPARLSVTAGPGLRGRTTFTVLIEDRTEHERVLRRLTERVAESEEKFRILFENAADPVFLQDLHGNILDCNKRACKLYGHSHAEMVGLDVQALLSSEAVKVLPAFRARVRREGRALVETRHKRRDGSLFDVEVSASLIELGGQQLIYVTCRDITMRKKLEREVRESEKKYRRLFESANDAIFLLDRDFTLHDCNWRACETYGYSRDELVGTNATELTTEETKRALPAIRKRIETAGHLLIEAQGKGRDGRVIDLEASVNIIEMGGRPRFMVICRDQSERKRAEAALRESEEKYRMTIHSMGDAINVVDKDRRIILANRRFRQWLEEIGHDIDPIGKRVPEAFPFLPKALRDEYAQVFESGRPLVTKESTVIGDREIMTETRKIPVFSEGAVVQVASVIRDITDRERLERDIRHSEEKYRALIENLDAGLIIIQDGKIQFANRTFFTVSGYSPNQVYGQPFEQLVSKTDRDRVEQRYRAREAGKPVSNVNEVSAVLADGRELTMESYSSLVTFEGRTATQVVLRDVTEQKLMERQLQRTARLASVGTLAAGVAHEINNPLAVISVDLPRLKRRHDNDPFVTRLCTKLMRMTDRISKITKGLLTFSKATTGSFGAHPVHCALNGALDLVASRFDFEHKRLIRAYPAKLPPVWCDSDQLQQVFVNICINALEATQQEATLTVTAKINRRNKTVALRFTDTGSGMTAEDIERAFDPFYTTKDTGTGLGLAICHSIVEEHNGTIQISSKPGQGTTVSVALPIHQPTRARRARERKPRSR